MYFFMRLTILKSLNGGHFGRHLEFLRMLNDAQLGIIQILQ